MKICVLGDTHIGGSYALGNINLHQQSNSRLIDYSNTFDYVIDYMIKDNVKHFVITGDIFEYRRPHAAELSKFSEKLYRLSELGIHTHIVIGNHDTIRDYGSTTLGVIEELKLPMVHIYSSLSSRKCVDGVGDPINLIFLPYRNIPSMGCKTNEEAVRRLNEALQYEIKSIGVGYKILIGHFMLKDTMLGNMVESSTEIVLPSSMFDGLDGTIMGHVHTHHIIQREPFIAYIGSMERKDFGDCGQPKYFLSIDNASGEIVYIFKQLPVRSIYDIELDQSLIDDGEKATELCIEELKEFDKNHSLINSIIRLNIILNDKTTFSFNIEKIRKTIKELKVNNCVNIHIQSISKRQLRKSSITEQIDPVKSFEEYLEFVENKELKELMKERGIRIIRGG